MFVDFIGSLLLRHPVLLQRFDTLFDLVPEARQCDDIVINLGNNFVDDLQFTLLSKRERRSQQYHEGEQRRRRHFDNSTFHKILLKSSWPTVGLLFSSPLN